MTNNTVQVGDLVRALRIIPYPELPDNHPKNQSQEEADQVREEVLALEGKILKVADEPYGQYSVVYAYDEDTDVGVYLRVGDIEIMFST